MRLAFPTLLVLGAVICTAFFFNHQTTPISQPARELSATEYRAAHDRYLKLQKTASARRVLETLRTDIHSNDSLARSCHSIAHEIGQREYKKDRDFGRAMSEQDDVCNSGFIHGLIEMYFVEHGGATTTMASACAPYTDEGHAAWECYHGVGHGLMFASSNDLPASITQCNQYRRPFAATACRNGAFMENFNTDPNAHPTKFASTTDLFFPCATFDSTVAGDCYLYAPVHYLAVHDNDYGGAISWCRSAPSLFRDACIRGVGTETMKRNISNPRFAEHVCSLGNMEERWVCIRGVAGIFLNHSGSLEATRDLCSSLKLVDRPACYFELDQQASSFN